MNIFYLSEDPVQCAEWMVDKHVVKMILETAQLLCTAHRLLDGTEGTRVVKVPVYKQDPDDPTKNYVDPETGENVILYYKDKHVKHWYLPDFRENLFYFATHRNHPSAIWARQSVENYNWLVDHLHALGKEYTHRYGKTHLTLRKMGVDICPPPFGLKDWDWTPMPSCMDDQYKLCEDPIINYRNYYQHGKSKLHKWTNRQPPKWLTLRETDSAM